MCRVKAQFTIGSRIGGRLHLPSPSPACTVYSYRVLLTQTNSIAIPDDTPDTVPFVTTQHFQILSSGTRPPKSVKAPLPNQTALWRGLEAGGVDEGDGWFVAGVDPEGRLPEDNVARPSTLPE